MMTEGLVFQVNDGLRNWQVGLDIYAFQKLPNGGYAVIEPLMMKAFTAEEAQQYAEHRPMLTIDRTSGQQLMDELWKVGLRPSEGSGSAGQLASTQKHLEDMRALVFQSQNVERPK